MGSRRSDFDSSLLEVLLREYGRHHLRCWFGWSWQGKSSLSNSFQVFYQVGISRQELVAMLQEDELQGAILAVLANKQVLAIEFTWNFAFIFVNDAKVLIKRNLIKYIYKIILWTRECLMKTRKMHFDTYKNEQVHLGPVQNFPFLHLFLFPVFFRL